MPATIPPTQPEIPSALLDSIRSACQRIPPLWTLRNFVAVNPFVGLSDYHFIDAAHLIQRVGHGETLMPTEFYRTKIAANEIQEIDFLAARKFAAATLPAPWRHIADIASLAALDKILAALPKRASSPRVLTFADFIDTQTGSNWAGFAVEEISKWCSAYYDQGQSSWRMPWRHLPLFAAWKQAAQRDANAELSGLPGFRAWVAGLPESHSELIAQGLAQLEVPEARRTDFLHRQLMSIAGWSSYGQFLVREKVMTGQTDDSLVQLLAIRMAYDLALLSLAGGDPNRWATWKKCRDGQAVAANAAPTDLAARYVAQQAMEHAYQRQLITKLKGHLPAPSPSGQKILQAVFCIDVRSEVFRRSLEQQSAEIETIGFAGFFGMAFEFLPFGQATGGAQCPVLLKPTIKIRESLPHAEANEEEALLRSLDFRGTVSGAWNAFRSSAISCFSFVETAGLGFGVKLARDSLALPASGSTPGAHGNRRRFRPEIQHQACCGGKHRSDNATGIPLPQQIALAAGALKNMGLTAGFAEVVLICGHGSATANNPYGSALDCGACGGHAGDANARVAVAILNQPAVREGLKQQGIEIPAETLFIAGLHNTTSDEILLFDTDDLTAAQAALLPPIENWLAAASRASRRERAASLGLAAIAEDALDEQVFQRGRDWSQVRPEWGLAGNAAFIAAPRERTRGLDLGGRTFLHNYHASRDPGNSTLELILMAPMVVASWINLQYYGSTVDNRLFGSGNKVLHNVVGTFGIWQGNGGDLQPGLPLQSIHDGAQLRHEPLRLNVFIEAECAAIEACLARQPGVRALVENGWVQLFAMDAASNRFWRYGKNQFVAEDNSACHGPEPAILAATDLAPTP